MDVQNSRSKNLIVVPTEITWNRRPKWEWQLPSKLVIASAEDGSTSLKLKVELETTDTGEVKSVNSFVDSRATGEFIDCHYAKSNWLHTWKLSEPIPVYNVDGTLNKAGSITEVVDLILRYWNHLERTLFAVTGLGKQKLILGHSWLQKHNPEIDWVTGEVKMSRCPAQCCSRCRDKAWVERIARKAEIQWTEAVSDGPVPELHTDSKEEEPEEAKETNQTRRSYLFNWPCSSTSRDPSHFQCFSALSWSTNVTLKLLPPLNSLFRSTWRNLTASFSKESFDALPESKK